ncbi:MAG: sulfotransferase [Pseudomonadota bacterium]
MKPDFIVIGTEKGGSTWLYDVLRAHPDVFLPDVKELHFFNRFDSNGQEIDKFSRYGTEWYLEYFEGAEGHKAIGEATPLYLSDELAAERIQSVLPEARFIAVLRHPVDRFKSHYRMAKAKSHIDGTVRDTFRDHPVEFLERGLYARHLRRWFDIFDQEQFLILTYDDLRDDPVSLLKTVAEWLGVDEGPLLAASPEDRRNAATGYRSARLYNTSVTLARALRQNRVTANVAKWLKSIGVYQMLKSLNQTPAEHVDFGAEDLEWLNEYYRQDIAELRALLGVDYGWLEDRKT